MSVICIMCTLAYHQALMDEMKDWEAEGAKIFLSGTTSKTSYGYLLVEWGRPIPENFLSKLRTDEGISHYFTIGKMLPIF